MFGPFSYLPAGLTLTFPCGHPYLPGHAKLYFLSHGREPGNLRLRLPGWGKPMFLGTLPAYWGRVGRSVGRQFGRLATVNAMIAKLFQIVRHGKLTNLLHARLA